VNDRLTAAINGQYKPVLPMGVEEREKNDSALRSVDGETFFGHLLCRLNLHLLCRSSRLRR
jgi:hypothetical protein